MSVAFVLGFVMAHVILTLFFLLVITPMGLVARLVGKDFLSLKLDRTAKIVLAAARSQSQVSRRLRAAILNQFAAGLRAGLSLVFDNPVAHP